VLIEVAEAVEVGGFSVGAVADGDLDGDEGEGGVRDDEDGESVVEGAGGEVEGSGERALLREGVGGEGEGGERGEDGERGPVCGLWVWRHDEGYLRVE
jgi:hypothetical protein